MLNNKKGNVRAVVIVFLIIGFLSIAVFDYQSQVADQFNKTIDGNSTKTYALLNETYDDIKQYGDDSLERLEGASGSTVLGALTITTTGILQILKSVIGFIKIVPTLSSEFLSKWLGLPAQYASFVFYAIMITIIFYIIYLWTRYNE